MVRLTLVFGLTVGVGALGIAVAGPPEAPRPRAIPVAELVKQLAGADTTERDAAEKRLSALALDPPPELLAAATSTDPVLRARAVKVARAMCENVAVTRLPRGQRFAERGQVDLFVAATAAWNLKADDERLWVPPQSLGRVLIKKADMKADRNPRNPSWFRDYATYKRLSPPDSSGRMASTSSSTLRRTNLSPPAAITPFKRPVSSAWTDSSTT